MLIILAVALMAAVLAGSRLLGDWREFNHAPLNIDSPVTLWLDSGSSIRSMVAQLEWLGLSRFDWRWRLFGHLHEPLIQAGEYRLEPGTRVGDLFDQLEAGNVLRHRFTVVEGWTVARLRRELAVDTRLRPASADLDEATLMARLGCPDCPAEGRFLPETYFFVRGSSDFDLLNRAGQAMEAALAEAWLSRDRSIPLDGPDELLVLASLIERETGRSAERTQVAGVFIRRLNLGMRLQTDPTVAYGLGEDFDGRLRRVHLQSDHPWNTYTRHGLPPTPIALPGRASLEAAANPAAGTALYFVSRGDGSHQFSDTLAEHNAAVNRYIRGRP